MQQAQAQAKSLGITLSNYDVRHNGGKESTKCWYWNVTVAGKGKKLTYKTQEEAQCKARYKRDGVLPG